MAGGRSAGRGTGSSRGRVRWREQRYIRGGIGSEAFLLQQEPRRRGEVMAERHGRQARIQAGSRAGNPGRQAAAERETHPGREAENVQSRTPGAGRQRNRQR